MNITTNVTNVTFVTIGILVVLLIWALYSIVKKYYFRLALATILLIGNCFLAYNGFLQAVISQIVSQAEKSVTDIGVVLFFSHLLLVAAFLFLCAVNMSDKSVSDCISFLWCLTNIGLFFLHPIACLIVGLIESMYFSYYTNFQKVMIYIIRGITCLAFFWCFKEIGWPAVSLLTELVKSYF